MGENVLNHPIKLIALDMDGTLLNDDHEVSEANRKAIKAAEKKGVHVILSTGRPYATCSDYAKSLELSSYLITVNGSEVYDEQAQLIQQQMINTEHIQWMYEISKTYKTGFWAISLEQVYREEMPEDIAASKWLKFGFDIQDDHVRAKVLDLLQTKKDLEISNSSPTNIEVNGLGVNKAKAIAFVGERLGITMDEVMAVGDSLNDLAMIKEAGLGVAMGNAQDIVKKTANWVTASNQEDGVAKAIEKWVLSS
jgi:HAD superfamily hydrolase (TIGR01484 family)